MIYKTISGTDLQVSAICMGNGFMKGNRTDEERFELLDAYFELGGNMVDSALVYGYDTELGKSRSEQTLGKWIKSRNNRNNIILTTKGAHPFPVADMKLRLSEEEIRGDLEKSLTTFGVDTIDLYWLHRDDPSRPAEEIAATVGKLINEGKIRYAGCSNWAPDRIEAAGCFAANQLSWSCARVKAHILARNRLVCMDEAAYKMHCASKLTAFAYSSQAQGLFSIIESDNTDIIKSKYPNYDLPENDQRYKAIIELSKLKNASPSQIALAWMMNKPFTAIPIVGCGRMEHLIESMKSIDIELSTNEAEKIGLW
jgi:aryl-alcohol dehydrogenase-like predicted oxidoreductase